MSIKRAKVKRTPGKNLPSIIAKNLAKDYYTAILELVSNSYDADAERLNIRYSSVDDVLICEDDGIGMDEQGIKHFYRMGDSEKIGNPISPIKKRRKIGKKGIGTVLLEYLGEQYALKTCKDGQKISITENFVETARGKKPFARYQKTDPKMHGTKISLSKLNMNNSNFDLDRLKTILEWQAPCLPDFNIYVNDVLLPKRNIISYCTEYAINVKIEGVGDVTGSLYYSHQKKVPTPGIFIYVNNRSVGDPMVDLHKINSLRKKVVGLVNADGLEPLIGFDRSRFREDSKEYNAVRAAIRTVLNSIEKDTRNFVSSRKFYTVNNTDLTRFENALKSAESRINKILVDEGKKPVRLEMKLQEDEHWISRHNDDGTVQINCANPQLAIKQRQFNAYDTYESTIIHLSLYALADSNLIENKGYSSLISNHQSNLFDVATSLYDGLEMLKDKMRHVFAAKDTNTVNLMNLKFNRYRQYLLEELSNLSGLDINTLKRLHNCGALPHSKKGVVKKFSADNIKNCFAKIDGYIPAAKILDVNRYSQDFKLSGRDPLVNFEKELNSLKEKPDYVVNVGTKKHPFSFIPYQRMEDFRLQYEKVIKEWK